MYMLDEIIARKLMSKPTTEIIALRQPIIQTVVAMKNHNLLYNH